MSNVQELKNAIAVANNHVSNFTQGVETNEEVVQARTAELKSLTKEELISRILELEAPKADTNIKVEDVARAILEDPACALLNYEQIASVIAVGLGSKTSGKSIASYASKRKEEWAIVAREKFKVDLNELLAASV